MFFWNGTFAAFRGEDDMYQAAGFTHGISGLFDPSGVDGLYYTFDPRANARG